MKEDKSYFNTSCHIVVSFLLFVVSLLSFVWLFCDPVATLALSLWGFPGKKTEGGCHFLLQGIFPTQGSNQGLLHWQVNSILRSQLVSWWKAWLPTPVSLAGASHGQGSLMGYSPGARKESDSTQHISSSQHEPGRRVREEMLRAWVSVFSPTLSKLPSSTGVWLQISHQATSCFCLTSRALSLPRCSWCHCHSSWDICGPGWCLDDRCKSALRNSPGHKNESEIKCCSYHYLLLSPTKQQVWDSVWLLWWFKYMQLTLEQHGFEMYRFTYVWGFFLSKYVQHYSMIESEDTEAWIQGVNCNDISWSLTAQGSALHPSHCWMVHSNDFLVSWELTIGGLTKELTFSPIRGICHCLACWFFFWDYQNLFCDSNSIASDMVWQVEKLPPQKIPMT